MKSILVATDNPLKFREIAEMLTLYGCHAQQVSVRVVDQALNGHAPFDWSTFLQPQASLQVVALVREDTVLRHLPGNRVEHESTVSVYYRPLSESGEPLGEGSGSGSGSAPTMVSLQALPSPQLWIERVRGHWLAAESTPEVPNAYDWDTRFVPAGSTLSLHALKERGQKVSARQRAIGAWLQHWLHYSEPVVWRHMRPNDNIATWLAEQPLLQAPSTAPTRALIERVHASGAWFKASDSRRVKHYWWPGLNAGIPMTPKKDYVHELTFLIHDLIHWSMPDVLPSGVDEQHHRLYMVTRMMSEAITLVMADMAFVDQALQAGLDYDTQRRRIHPLYDPSVPLQDWCRALSHYAIRGDDRLLASLAPDSQVLADFQAKYAPFFEEDLRWTAHNAQHLRQNLDPQWIALHARFAASCDLQLTRTQDFLEAWSENDALLVDQVFNQLWALHWDEKHSLDPSLSPAVRRAQRWWLGQLALTYKMDDLPLSRVVRDTVSQLCCSRPTLSDLNALTPLWDNYIDALEGLSRISSNDAAVFKTHYPITPPLYVSYDLGRDAYQGIPAMWARVRTRA